MACGAVEKTLDPCPDVGICWVSFSPRTQWNKNIIFISKMASSFVSFHEGPPPVPELDFGL